MLDKNRVVKILAEESNPIMTYKILDELFGSVENIDMMIEYLVVNYKDTPILDYFETKLRAEMQQRRW